MQQSFKMRNKEQQNRQSVVWKSYGASVILLMVSVIAAVSLYPSYFDWQYTVISALATEKHNPDGFRLFSAGLALSLLLVWPVVSNLRAVAGSGQRLCLKLGILSGVAMAIESWLSFALPESLEKLHELFALLTFLFLYAGIISVSISLLRKSKSYVGPALVILTPLIAIGLSQLALYLDQRDLGWVDQSWREMGIAVWKSFAFWQWLALWSLWAAIGGLAWIESKIRPNP